MVIYSKEALDELDFKPVDTEKKKRATKKKEEEKPVPAITLGPKPEEHPTHGGKQLPVKIKKPPTEKQLAARAKAAEARKAKKEAELNARAEQLLNERNKQALDSKKDGGEKKTAKGKKNEGGIRKPRERKRKEVDNDTLVESPAPVHTAKKRVKLDTPPPTPPKKQVPRVPPPPPPTPIKPKPEPKFIRQMAEAHVEEKVRKSGVAKSKREIRQEAKQLAAQVWKNPATKSLVENASEAHMQKMYAMIFPKRKAKL